MADFVLLIGIPASGKSSFYRDRFADTHVRVNRDMLKAAHRETKLRDICLELGIPIVLDNTNVTRKIRAAHIAAARAHSARVVGYYFSSRVSLALDRNRARGLPVPDKAVLGQSASLELPTLREGFNELWFVRAEGNTFDVEPWKDEQR
jgi:predicted kinase